MTFEAILILILIIAVSVLGPLIYLRRSKSEQIDAEALKQVRLHTRGQGWNYADNWPFAKKGKKTDDHQ